MLFQRNSAAEFFIRAVVACIDAVIPNHFEIGFRDVSDKSFHEIQYGNGFINKLVVFMPVVVEGDRITVIFINTGSGDNRASKVSADVFGDNGRIAEVGFSIDIKPVLLLPVNRGFDFFEGITNSGMHFVKENGLKRFPKKLVVEVFKRTPTTGITNAAF